PLIIEAAIPTLLVLPRFRRAGVLLAAGFHYILGIGFYDFSGIVYALFFLFTGEDFVRAVDCAPAWFRSLRSGRLLRAIPVALVGLVGAVAAYDLVVEPGHMRTFRIFMWAWIAWGLLLTAAYVVVSTRQKAFTIPRVLSPRFPEQWAFAVLLVVNSICPYLGL